LLKINYTKFLVQSVLDSGVSLFGDSFPDTLVSWKADQSFVAFSEEEDVAGSGGENVSGGILDVDDVEGTWMSLSGLDGTDSTDILTADDLAHVTGVEFDPVGDFVGGEVELDGVTDFAVWVWVSDGSSVVCHQVWDVVLLVEELLHSAELVASLLSGDSVNDESALGVIDESEVLVGLLEGDNIHETGWVFAISSDLAVNLDHLSHHDLLALVASKSVVESVSDEDGEWEALSELVWAGIWSVAENAAGLWEHPVVWSVKGFEVLLRSATSHGELCSFD